MTHLRGSQILEKSLKHSSNPKVPRVYLAPGNVAGSKGWLKSFPQRWTETRMFSPGQLVMQNLQNAKMRMMRVFIFLFELDVPIVWLFSPHQTVTPQVLQRYKINQQQTKCVQKIVLQRYKITNTCSPFFELGSLPSTDFHWVFYLPGFQRSVFEDYWAAAPHGWLS